jgi:hypothetical protein
MRVAAETESASTPLAFDPGSGCEAVDPQINRLGSSGPA